MNTIPVRLATAAALLAALGLPQARAYETPVHAQITESAFVQAVKDRNFLKELGVLHFFERETGLLRMEGFEGRTPAAWAQLGSMAEDNFIRSAFHFFDPTVGDAARAGLKGVFMAAPDWALSAERNPTYSIPGTRDSLYGALTNTDTIVRPKMWRDAFRGVGQFTHLLQDMSQPQHVRDDDHFSLTEEFYFIFPDYSRYEKRTLFRLTELAYGGYPAVRQRDYRSFWANTANTGLAQFANLNFVSEHTNLDDTKYASPRGTLLREELIPQVFDLHGAPIPGATDVTVRYVQNTFVDANSGSAVTNPRLSAFSIFDFERQRLAARPMYSLYNTNHDAYADLLIPRAVGYSAGLMGHFFRGSMEIAPPDELVYGIVDHAQVQQSDPVNGFAGFDTVKLKVRNTTANGERMPSGNLVAVAKFHRNGCYRDDLTGEFTSLAPPCPNFRTEVEEIVVSEPHLGVELTGELKPFTFRFPQPIPINATDLYLQLVYRGALVATDGTTEADAVVVATKDLKEPTYIAFCNSTDQFLYRGTFVPVDSGVLLSELDVNPKDGVLDSQFRETPLDIYFSFTEDFITPIATAMAVPPGRYVRVAILADRDQQPSPVEAESPSFFSSGIVRFNTETVQLDVEANVYRISILGPLRGVNQFGSLTYYKSFGSPSSGDLATLPAITQRAPMPLTTLHFPTPLP